MFAEDILLCAYIITFTLNRLRKGTGYCKNMFLSFGLNVNLNKSVSTHTHTHTHTHTYILDA